MFNFTAGQLARQLREDYYVHLWNIQMFCWTLIMPNKDKERRRRAEEHDRKKAIIKENLIYKNGGNIAFYVWLENRFWLQKLSHYCLLLFVIYTWTSIILQLCLLPLYWPHLQSNLDILIKKLALKQKSWFFHVNINKAIHYKEAFISVLLERSLVVRVAWELGKHNIWAAAIIWHS